MMLRHLGETEAAAAVDRAIESVLAHSEVRTPDIGGKSKTRELSEAILREIST